MPDDNGTETVPAPLQPMEEAVALALLVEGQRTMQPLVREALEAKRDHHRSRSEAWDCVKNAAKDAKILWSVAVAIVLLTAGFVYWAFGLAPGEVGGLIRGGTIERSVTP